MYAIVLMPKGHHRKIAQEHWGLTDEQMKGMHVHHRVPRSKGGTDAPENLYVCSPSFHQEVWHNGRYKQIVKANNAAVSGGLTNKLLHQENKTGYYAPKSRKKSGKTRGLSGSCAKAGAIGGSISGKKRSKEQMSKMGREGAKALHSQRWQCLETGYVSNAGGLSRYQVKRGIPIHKRKRIDDSINSKN